jgi:dephospho-CoA kinase
MICVVGPSCAGKTTICDWLVTQRNYIHIEASAIVRARHAVDGGNLSMNDYVQAVFDREGKKAFAVLIADEILQAEYNLEKLVISGLRTQEAVHHFQSKFGTVSVLGVYAQARMRFERNLARPRPLSPQNYRDFILKDMQEYAFGIADLLVKEAQHFLVNEETSDSLYSDLAQVLEKLK